MTLKGMLDRKIILVVVTPLLRRLGTAFATYLVATGTPADTVEAAGLWATAGIGIMVDLALGYFNRKRREDAIVAHVLTEQLKPHGQY